MEILIIEDDIELAQHLKKELKKRGHEITTCSSASEAIVNNYAYNHDIVILDLMLKDEHGEKFAKHVKKENIRIPIIVLSSIANTSSKIDLLKSGADDYMTKPFDIEELVVRLEVLQKRYMELPNNSTEKYKNVAFCWDENKVVRDGKEIFLTNKEGKLLKYLVRNKGKVVKSDDLIKHVWNVGPGYHSNILQSLIRHLRKQLDENFKFKLIKNIHGVGYIIELPEEQK